MPSILIRCDGNQDIGMGHVSRCLALADELRDRERRTVSFAMRGSGTAGAAAIRAAGYAIDAIAADANADYGDELNGIAASRGAAAPARRCRGRRWAPCGRAAAASSR